jgi:hypothetical protein
MPKKTSSKKTTSPEASKPSPTAKGNTFSHTRDLTPSEIESLRQNGKEVHERASAFFKKQIEEEQDKKARPGEKLNPSKMRH